MAQTKPHLSTEKTLWEKGAAYYPAFILAASGVAGVVIPEQVAEALSTDLSDPHARAEFRVNYGALTALGVFGMVKPSRLLSGALAAYWLGGASFRLISFAWDRPDLSAPYLGYLVFEIVNGSIAAWAALHNRD